MKRFILFVAILLTCFSSALHGTEFAVMSNRLWQQAATADYRLLLIKITRAKLYVDTDIAAPQNILEPSYPKWLQIQYDIDVSAEKLRELTLETLVDKLSPEALAPHRSAIERFVSLYRDVEEGDRYNLMWHPDSGLQLHWNERLLGSVSNADSAAVILSVWLGDAAISTSQRDDILEQWQTFVRETPAKQELN